MKSFRIIISILFFIFIGYSIYYGVTHYRGKYYPYNSYNIQERSHSWLDITDTSPDTIYYVTFKRDTVYYLKEKK